ncbi:riboflavin-specific deaminase-like protein [Rhodoligotrophos appendicifer]|uniref:RibD family protein n=1 Tax=Rhodoligotrophos appendicifer TaxID=987056 RepID=UPI001185F3B0|nr:RibD family protein [Rhodoligotrophos appendicifer]
MASKESLKSVSPEGLHDRSGAPFVIAQLGQTLDGRISTLGGKAEHINGNAALDHLHRLRASVDAVVVGAGTVIADDPQLTVRRVPGQHPARVIIDPGGRVPISSRCFDDTGSARIIISSVSAPQQNSGIKCIRLALKDGQLDPHEIVRALRNQGLHRILIEGGSQTVSRFLAAKALDRIHLLVAPIILGSGTTGINLPSISDITMAVRPRTSTQILDDGNVLFDCDLR